MGYQIIDYATKYLDLEYYIKITSKPYTRPNYSDIRKINPKDGEKFGFADSFPDNIAEAERSIISLPIPEFEDTLSSEYGFYNPSIQGAMVGDVVNVKIKDTIRDFMSGTFTDASTANSGIGVVEARRKKFRAVKPREFTLTWKFRPRSADEAKDIAKIILIFKMNSMPGNNTSESNSATKTLSVIDNSLASMIKSLFDGKNGAVSSGLSDLTAIFETVKLPDTFYIKPFGENYEKSHTAAWLFAIKPSYVSNVSVKYGETNKVEFFHDGFPTYTELSVTFLEITDLRREDYNIKLGGN